MADLQTQVLVSRDEFTLEATIKVAAGAVLAVVGPNGSGKTTLLRTIAGLTQPNSGRIRLAGKTLTDTTRGVALPPPQRRVGLLAQDARLFPHLSVLENVAFGPRCNGHGTNTARRMAREWLDRVGMGKYARRRPAALSGGQAQRVALARALAAQPDVLLLDEPLAALDAQSAPVLRQLIAEQVRSSGTTTMLVSHDVLDAVVLADEIAVLHEGAVAERGPVTEVLAAPRTAFTAALAGINLLSGVVDRQAPLQVRTSWGVWQGSRQADRVPEAGPVEVGQECLVRVHPADLTVHRQRPSGPNSTAATVRWLEPSDGGVRVRLAGREELVAEVELATVDPNWLYPGAELWVQVRPERVRIGAWQQRAGQTTSPGPAVQVAGRVS